MEYYFHKFVYQAGFHFTFPVSIGQTRILSSRSRALSWVALGVLYCSSADAVSGVGIR